MLQVAHTGHRFGPARVGEQVEGDELEPRGVGAVGGEGFPHFFGPFEAAHRTTDGIALREQLQGDVAAEKAGNAGDEDAVRLVEHLGYPSV